MTNKNLKQKGKPYSMNFIKWLDKNEKSRITKDLFFSRPLGGTIKDRVLVVEDDYTFLHNALDGIYFGREKSIDSFLGVSSMELAKEAIDYYQPDMALLDMHFYEEEQSKHAKKLGVELGKVMEKNNIPYLFVTGEGQTQIGDHLSAKKIAIKNSSLENVLEIEGGAKTPEVWKVAYDKLNEIYGRK